ncbi:MAG: serine/threonine protein kinase [Deltaproteobacteria bacterium]|nr:serine/threonine protein kinase [Deltaproteobacteria bacterium]
MPTSLADGRYLLVSGLGEGGMATVYRAYDQRLQVWRAIKILAPQYASKPKLRSRFEAEAQTMALLEHRNIVRVYDVGHDGPYAYIVMELVEGGSLVDWLERNGAMPPRLAVDVIVQLCRGIEVAHKSGTAPCRRDWRWM